nr:hypothetical protein [uncultured Roseateles sp.]
MIPRPPPLSSLPAGAQLIAGIGVSTVVPAIDFETYSEAGFVWSHTLNKWCALPGAAQGKKGLPVIGAPAYALHPSTEVLSLSYDLKDGRGKRRWRPGLSYPLDLFAHVMSGGLLEAWNVPFERWIWGAVCVPKYGFPPMRIDQWRCAMAKARAWALPPKLEVAGQVLRTTVQKDADGKRLLDKFSMPRNPTKKDPRTRIRPEDDPADAERLYSYNDTDVEAEDEIASRVPDMPALELQHWLNDQAINARGVQIDMRAVEAAISILEQAQAKYTPMFRELVGCAPTELQQFKGWLHAQGVHTDSLDEEALEELLARTDLAPHVRRALEIRALVGSASVKKVYAMRNRVTPAGRLHEMYVFYGTRTGRPTGEGVQSTNLPKAGPNVYRCGCGKWHGAHTMRCPWCGITLVRGPKDAKEWNPDAMQDAISVLVCGSLELLEHFFGDALRTVAGCLRGFFIAAPGRKLVSSDFTAIEGVVIACLAGEQWRIEFYRTGGEEVDGVRLGIYEVSASKAFGVPLTEFARVKKETGQHHPKRQIGKGMELGLGFGGWIGALKQFDVPGTDDDLKEACLAWRGASPAIVYWWGGQRRRTHAGWVDQLYGLEGASIKAVQNPGLRCPVERMDGSYSGVTYLCHDDVLYCFVPSGGYITYHRPRLEPARDAWRGLSLTYEGWNTNAKNGPYGWIRMSLYGGKHAENVTQKVARDIQMHAINNLERRGYPVVMHTYDEDVAEVPEAFGSVEELEAHMVDVPEWARGWPIKAAGGWQGGRYRKA